MKNRSLPGLALLTLAALASPAHAQQRFVEPSGPNFRKLVTVDSGGVQFASISPDNRWVVMSVAEPTCVCLWIASADGHGVATRLTSAGYRDLNPIWFMSSDRIVFTSNRPTRGTSLKLYGMTLAIDPRTGRAAGPPRQVTTEAVAIAGYPSPDGKWIAYATPGDSIKIVPSSGGTARFVTKTSGGAGLPMWYVDGRSLVFSTHRGAPPLSWYRVWLTGGTPQKLEHAPFFGRLHVHAPGQVGSVIKRLELRDSTERLVAAADIPAGMRLALFNYTTAAVGITSTAAAEVHVVSAAGGNPRVIGSLDDGDIAAMGDRVAYLESWVGTADAVDVVPLAGGGALRRIVLPDSERLSYATVDGKLLYWKSPAGSCHLRVMKCVAGVRDVTANTSRLISANFVQWSGDSRSSPTSGDEVPFVERTGSGFELRAWSPVTSSSRLVRSIAAAPVSVVSASNLRGDLAAYSVSFHDSTSVFVSTSPSAAPEHVITLRSSHSDGLSLSSDGRHLAFGVQIIKGAAESHAIGFVDLKADGSLAGPPRLVPTVNITDVTWFPDSRDVAFIRLPNRDDRAAAIMRLSADDDGRPRVISGDERLPSYDFTMSPDGNWIAYPVDRPGRVTLWRVDFEPVGGATLTGRPPR